MQYFSKKRGIHYKVAGVRLLFTVFASCCVCLSGNDDFPLAKVECLQGDGKYRPTGLFRKTVFGKPSHFMLKWVFLKLSNEIPCLTPSYIGTLVSKGKGKVYTL